MRKFDISLASEKTHDAHKLPHVEGVFFLACAVHFPRFPLASNKVGGVVCRVAQHCPVHDCYTTTCNVTWECAGVLFGVWVCLVRKRRAVSYCCPGFDRVCSFFFDIIARKLRSQQEICTNLCNFSFSFYSSVSHVRVTPLREAVPVCGHVHLSVAKRSVWRARFSNIRFCVRFHFYRLIFGFWFEI